MSTTIYDTLSKSEKNVLDYIKKGTNEGQVRLKESMKNIGSHLGTSEATVHRAVRKLRKSGIIGIVPSQEKAESNMIEFYGIPNEDKQATEIFDMVSTLSSSVNRFRTILENKDLEIENCKRKCSSLEEKMNKMMKQLRNEKELSSALQETLQKYDESNPILSSDHIISVTDLDNGTIAYIVKQ